MVWHYEPESVRSKFQNTEELREAIKALLMLIVKQRNRLCGEEGRKGITIEKYYR